MRAAFRFLQLAGESPIDKDPLAKSEMLWCAAAHMVKAVAKKMHWENRTHEQLFDAAAGINDEIGIRSAYADFNAAHGLHQNMYEGFMSDPEIFEAETAVQQLVHRVAQIID